MCTLGPYVVPLTKILVCIQTGAERIGTGSVLKSSFTISKKFFSSAFIDIVLVNTQVNSTFNTEFSGSVIAYRNMLISSKVNKMMCENKQIIGHTPMCIVFIHSVFREPHRR